ncbi:hypothetical protein AGABI1DRAFT_32949 [Agaricus bisporus var. burnettii JB137-S8]|uniref:Mediator of RNA polymerase II transcription subunit 11 n=1 Tax=Agaricus bisporus var. burnettii (strain JB137-S8 / ATCC MYA-4627 / FGSC 10392) TaxID=597362 RepID=K5Y715_AGABU|nr:uncharacterized protein AGABI1DRAFT_32949 [Agaricus bisporus var. burnettii JB137-S8]EKM84005.1 hypothetical protein AGABI1DRAFT_32949 [Agaricus bisporus var. burnettii JB137-S8]
MDHEQPSNIDPIWTTSRTARQIYALGQVEKVYNHTPEDNLPPGEERSEQFVLEVSEYFERLDAVQVALRSSLAHIRHSRIAPSAINAPQPSFIPPSLGVGLPPETDGNSRVNRGLQEERVERDAWKGILEALRRLKENSRDTGLAEAQHASLQ